jgi:hypothetical protein
MSGRWILRAVLAAVLSLCFVLPAAAQYIGILQSAETMDKGTFKLMAAPILAFGKNGADDEFGVAVRGGYGFTGRFDAEAKLGFFQNGTFLGADGEIWILKGAEKDVGVDFSLTGGVHRIFGKDDYSDVTGFDLTPLLSAHVGRNVELCGALDVSFESVSDVPEGADDSFTRLHFVPGIEYRLSSKADLEAEFGLGLNDDSWNYVGFGVALYLRR